MGRLKDMFSSLDHSHDGLITFEEFGPLMKTQTMKNYMATLELEVDDAQNVFTILDLDNEGGITFNEFIQGMKSIRGGARRIDVATLLKLVRRISTIVESMPRQRGWKKLGSDIIKPGSDITKAAAKPA